MNLITISSVAWHKHNAQASAITHHLLASQDGAHITLDVPSVTRSHTADTPVPPTPLIPLARWLKLNTEDYRLDLNALNTDALAITEDTNLFVDASGYPVRVLEELARGIRQTWFPLPDWPASLVIIADDADLLHISELFADMFYIRPVGLNSAEVKRITKRLVRRATLARWFGIKATRVQRAADKLWSLVELLFAAGDQIKSERTSKWKHQ